MSPDLHLEAPITMRRLKRSFESFGMIFEYTVVEETMPAWEMTKQDDDPEKVNWTLSGATKTTSYVEIATVRSPKAPHDSYGRHITLFMTAEGPILGIVQRPQTDFATIRHPALVQYAGGTLKLRHIFGVERAMNLNRAATLSSMPPSEALLAAYAGFIMQSNMGQFMRTPAKPIHTHEEEL